MVTERVAPELLLMPPPRIAELIAELPDRMELVTERAPALLKAPPLPEVFCAPETVTPEMLRLPPAAMLKILKLRVPIPLLPLMVSEVAPRPLMVKVPTVLPVPPEPVAVNEAFKIVGNAAEARVMV